jgi:hypothetical protein
MDVGSVGGMQVECASPPGEQVVNKASLQLRGRERRGRACSMRLSFCFSDSCSFLTASALLVMSAIASSWSSRRSRSTHTCSHTYLLSYSRLLNASTRLQVRRKQPRVFGISTSLCSATLQYARVCQCKLAVNPVAVHIKPK